LLTKEQSRGSLEGKTKPPEERKRRLQMGGTWVSSQTGRRLWFKSIKKPVCVKLKSRIKGEGGLNDKE